jgi:hypothetical protein
MVAGDALYLLSVVTDLDHIGGLTLPCHAGSVVMMRRNLWDHACRSPTHPVAGAVARPHRTVRRIRLLEAAPRLAHSATDRVSAWEHSLMLEASATGSVQWLPGQDVNVGTL